MCYAKPGPRCSGHAHSRYTRAQEKVLTQFYVVKQIEREGLKDTPEHEVAEAKLKQLISNRRKAEEEYYQTPAGIKELEDRAKKWPNSNNAVKAEIAKQIYTTKLEAAKTKGLKQINHKVSDNLQFPEQTFRFSEPGEELHIFPISDVRAKKCLDEGERVAVQVSDDEIVAFRWYTADGFGDINRYASGLRTHNGSLPYDEEYQKKLGNVIKHLDALFERQPVRETPITVYRRHGFFTDEGRFDEGQTIVERLPVGSVFSPNYYLSTSINTDTLVKTSTEDVVNFEIRTKRGVSVTGISSHGATELEYLLPRDAKYRVVSNTQTRVVVNETGEKETMRIVQLEEL